MVALPSRYAPHPPRHGTHPVRYFECIANRPKSQLRSGRICVVGVFCGPGGGRVCRPDCPEGWPKVLRDVSPKAINATALALPSVQRWSKNLPLHPQRHTLPAVTISAFDSHRSGGVFCRVIGPAQRPSTPPCPPGRRPSCNLPPGDRTACAPLLNGSTRWRGDSRLCTLQMPPLLCG